MPHATVSPSTHAASECGCLLAAPSGRPDALSCGLDAFALSLIV
jgi:hypothetical protein